MCVCGGGGGGGKTMNGLAQNTFRHRCHGDCTARNYVQTAIEQREQIAVNSPVKLVSYPDPDPDSQLLKMITSRLRGILAVMCWESGSRRETTVKLGEEEGVNEH